MEETKRERVIIANVQEIRREDPGIGGYKLWIMLCALFGPGFMPGRDSFYMLLRRYRLPFRRAFSLCAADLSRLSRAVGCSYHLLNLLLFVVVYVIAVCFNLLPALLLLT